MTDTGLRLAIRPRRNRGSLWSRNLVTETRLSVDNLIWPVFVHDGTEGTADQPITSMPGVVRYGIDSIVQEVQLAKKLGIPAVALFPKIDSRKKSPSGDEALNPKNIICQTLGRLKESVPGIGLICDVALDPYTDHGHDGLIKHNRVDNDSTVKFLCQQALVQAKAGADVIAPSDMMDGRVGEIRAALDAEGFAHVQILSYAAKYASSFYGPFRDAVGSEKLVLESDRQLGFRDKSTYQMNPANTDEAILEAKLDIEQGADMVMVKPGMPYLDIVYRIHSELRVPTLVYQVSGEYASLMAAAKQGWLDEKRAFMESLLAFRRAGACGVLSYYARQAAALLART